MAAARATINDVAALAGVSRQTVSNVLNDRGGFTDDTRQAVLDAMARLDYRPSRAARSLRSRRTMQLGYHMPGDQLAPENAFVLRLVQALVKAAAGRGYHLLVFGGGDRQVFGELIAVRGVDGFLLSSAADDDARVRYLAAAGVPFAVFGRTHPELPQAWVDIDNAAAVATAVDHLAAAGRRAFAYVGYDPSRRWDAERLDGYRAALRGRGLDLDEGRVVLAASLAEVHEPLRRLLAGPERPDAVVTGSDVLAAAVVGVAASLGLRAGRELDVTGFDGGFVQSITEPPLTSVRIPVEEIAARLVERCLDELEAGPTGRPGLVLPTAIGPGGTA
jgi:DNA-binding LacI/PurR family transcriptional regulator